MFFYCFIKGFLKIGSYKFGFLLFFDYKRWNKVVFFLMKIEIYKKVILKLVECLFDFGYFIFLFVSIRFKC